MDPFSITPNYSKRDYLLPDGCKDLIDVLRLQQKKLHSCFKQKQPLPKPAKAPAPKGNLLLPATITVRKLAALLDQKLFIVTADLMELGIFASLDQEISFEIAAQVSSKYGFTATQGL